jgi:hypothetical protein
MHPPTAALLPEHTHVRYLQIARGYDVDMQTVPAGMQLENPEAMKTQIFFSLAQRA